MTRDQLFHYFFFALFAWLLFQFMQILEPFLTPLLGALVLLIIVYPLHLRLSKALRRQSDNFRAAMSTLMSMTLVVGPFIVAMFVFYQESQTLSPMVKDWMTMLRDFRHEKLLMNPHVQYFERHILTITGLRTDELNRMAMGFAGNVFGSMSEMGGYLAKNAILSLGQIMVLAFILFFLFRDGEDYLVQLKNLIPMKATHKTEIIDRLRDTITGIVRGSVLTSIFQTACSIIGYGIVGVPAFVTMGLLTGVASFIPVVGSALIWAPIAVGFILKGAIWKGIFILIWGLVLVSTIDNLLRTYLIGEKANLPVLFLFFGLVGGAELYGIRGVLLGPLLISVLPIFISIYREYYLRRSNETM